MIAFARPLALLLAVPLLALTLFSLRHAYTNLSRERMRAALIARLVVLIALVLSLAGTSLRLPRSHQATVFVADLSASDAGQRSTLQAAINQAAADRKSVV